MIEHIALAHRNTGHGWVVMSSDGRPWEAEAVFEREPLAAAFGEALALLARHPAADFTFTTRAAREVMAAPYDRQNDLAGVERDLARASISVLVPIGEGRWRLLHKETQGWFRAVDTCEAADVHDFLRDRPEDATAIDKGLAGAVEIWLRRRWNAEAVTQPRTLRDNVTPLMTRPRFRQAMGAG